MGYHPEGNYADNTLRNMYYLPSPSASAASSTPILDAAWVAALTSPQATPSTTPTNTKPTFNFPVHQSAFRSHRRQARQRLGAHPFLLPTAGPAPLFTLIWKGVPPRKRDRETGHMTYPDISRVKVKDLKNVAEKADALAEMMQGLEMEEKDEDEEMRDVSAEEGTEEQK